jgi:hypothetical protein
MKRKKLTTTLEDVRGEYDVTVEYDWTPGRPAVMYLRNGDPGYPEDPAEFEIVRIEANGLDITSDITEPDLYRIEQLIWEAEE